MNVFVPYTQLERITRRALSGTGYKAIQMTDDEAYVRYFEERWAKAETFINVEHDIVPWPGALEELWKCPEPWCAHGYRPDDDLTREGYSVFLGCAKISDVLIRALPDCWKMKPNRHWNNCDSHLTDYARKHGLVVHQHRPAVLNIGQGFKVHNPESPDN